jgi:hypothetical protein
MGCRPQRGRGHRIGRQLDVQGCSLAGRAQDQKGAAEGLDPVSQADDAGAAARVGAADAIVADGQGEDTVTGVHAHVDDRGLCVLGGVGDRLRRDVITGRLDVLVKPRAEIQVEFDRHRGAPAERLQCWAEPGLRQQGRVDAVRDLPQFVQGGTSVATRRSAACSPASRSISARASLFAIAVAMSSVNAPMRISVAAGSGSCPEEPTAMTPHSRPATSTGTPTAA